MASTREMLEELCRHLSTNSSAGGSTVFVVGRTVYANALPHSTRATVGLFEAPGPGPVWHFGEALPAWEDHVVSVRARSTAPGSKATIPNPTNAKRMARRALTRLEAVTNQTVQGSTYLRIAPLTSLHLIDIEEDGRQVYGCDLAVSRRPSTSGLN